MKALVDGKHYVAEDLESMEKCMDEARVSERRSRASKQLRFGHLLVSMFRRNYKATNFFLSPPRELSTRTALRNMLRRFVQKFNAVE